MKLNKTHYIKAMLLHYKTNQDLMSFTHKITSVRVNKILEILDQWDETELKREELNKAYSELNGGRENSSSCVVLISYFINIVNIPKTEFNRIKLCIQYFLEDMQTHINYRSKDQIKAIRYIYDSEEQKISDERKKRSSVFKQTIQDIEKADSLFENIFLK